MKDNALYPNSFQVNNFYIDQCLHLLDGSEVKILFYVIRRIIGFNKRFDRISLSQFLSGVISSEGEHLDFGVGLSRANIITSLNALKKYGLLIEVEHSNNPKLGNAYTLQFDYSKVDLAGLEQRQLNKSKNTSLKIRPVQKLDQSKNYTSLKNELVDQPKNDQKLGNILVQKLDPQNSVREEKNKKEEKEEKEKINKKEKEEIFSEQPSVVASSISDFSNLPTEPKKTISATRKENQTSETKFEAKISPPKQEKTKLALSFFPRPFNVTPEMREWAKEKTPLVSWQEETENFKDWALSNAIKKADWEATWRNWLRRTQQALEARNPKNLNPVAKNVVEPQAAPDPRYKKPYRNSVEELDRRIEAANKAKVN